MCVCVQMQIKSHPFEHLPFHGRVRKDCVLWRTTYSDISGRDFDPSKPEHAKHIGVGQVLLLFKCLVQLKPGTLCVEKQLAFIEEYWPYRPARPDQLLEEFGCNLYYSTLPNKAYYVIDIQNILGPALILPNMCCQTIPKGGLTGVRSINLNAREDTNSARGNKLFRMNRWAMMRGEYYGVSVGGDMYSISFSVALLHLCFIINQFGGVFLACVLVLSLWNCFWM